MTEKKPVIPASAEPPFAAFLHQKGAALGIPLSGTFELTPQCNFNCKMCYVHQQKPAGNELTTAQWLKIAAEARKKGMLFLLLTGGEPLFRPDFKELYSQLTKMGFLISINTNGSLIDDEMLAFLTKNKPCRMNISLYGGCEETYRNLCGVSSFRRVADNIRALKEAGISVKLNASITPYNAEDIEKIYTFARDLEVHVQATTYMYPPVRINGERYGEAPARFNSSDAAKYMLQCREQYMTPEQLCRSAMNFCLDEDDEMSETSPGECMRCRAGKTAFWVTWDGRMLPCGMFPQEGYWIDKVGFEKAWEAVRADTASVRLPGKCADCSLKNACGACAAACYAETGTFYQVPEYICAMTRKLNQLTLEKYVRGDV